MILKLQYDKTALRDVLSSLAAQANLNLLIEPKLASGVLGEQGRMVPAFTMKNVTATEALGRILAKNGLEIARYRESNIYRVQPRNK